MFSYFITACVGGVATMSLYAFAKYKLSGSKYNFKVSNDTKGEIYMLDHNIDKKFTIGELVVPTYNAFDKPNEICMMIDKIPKDKKIKLILMTKGGELSACEKILKKLKRHPAGYIAYICQECYSAGALLALGADSIVMNAESYIGKIDPQLSDGKGAISAVNVRHVNVDNLSDADSVAIVNESKNVLNYLNELLKLVLSNHNDEIKSQLLKVINENFIYSNYPHSKLFDYSECRSFGLDVREPYPEELQYFKFYESRS